MTTTKHLGHCPICGRPQAIIRGTLAHHGYRVVWNSFNGPCPAGRTYEPIETAAGEAVARDNIARLRSNAARLRQQAADYDAGTAFPATVRVSSRRYGAPTIPWADAPQYERQAELRTVLGELVSEAEYTDRLAQALELLVAKRAGQPLIDAQTTRPEPIPRGERRDLGPGRVGVVRDVVGGTVYYLVTTPSSTFTARASTRWWRARPLLPAVAA